MRVPVLPLLLEVIDIDERHARLDQPATEQQVLSAHEPGIAHLGPVAATAAFAHGHGLRTKAVFLADRLWLAGDIDGIADGVRTEELIRAIQIVSEPLADGIRGID